MKKLLLLAIGAMFALSLTPSAADVRNGCEAVGQGPTGAIVCKYTAAGPGVWAAATPNSYTIKVERGLQTLTLVSRETSPPEGGILETLAGDKVTVSMGPDCVPGTGTTGCGTVGVVRASDQ